MMKGEEPSGEILLGYIGDKLEILNELSGFVHANYGYGAMWSYSKKHDRYECKYRKGDKTLVAFYIEKDALNVLLVYGKKERESFEKTRSVFSPFIIDLYDHTRQYHDGKWLYIPLQDGSLVDDVQKLILIKRKPPKPSAGNA